MKQILPQKAIHFVIILKLSLASLQVLHPVLAGILKIYGEPTFSLLVGNFLCKDTRFLHMADIPLEFCRHKPNAAIGQKLMCLPLVNPETYIVTSFPIKQKVTERGMM